MSLVIYDTLRREKVPFRPREEGKASIYVCGPTVQADAHVGHGRYAVVFDVLRRWLIASGYEVLYVTNITDVDDKIIMRANREGSTQAIVAETYARAWNRTMDKLGVLPPDVQPRATGHILDMQALIEDLVAQDKAYESGGNVLFRVRRFGDYGKLSGRRVDEMVQGEDVVAAEHKDDPLDFALWKAAKPDEPSWPSPWGPGRPGWHIECSAMAVKHLGPGFDIHGGGLDLVFPHHENEIAQFEAAHDEVFARHWIHNGMVQMGDEKMSKSVGNIVGLETAVERWGLGPLRLWYLSAHHRSPLVYEEDRLHEGVAAFERFTTFLRTAALVLEVDELDPAHLDASLREAADASTAADAPRRAFADALDDDLNAPRAVAALHDLVAAGHERLAAAERGDDQARGDVLALAHALVELGDGVLGLHLTRSIRESQDAGRRIAPVVDHLLEERSKARADRDFATADAIRDELTEIGVVVEDRPGGSRWYVDPNREAPGGRSADDGDDGDDGSTGAGGLSWPTDE